MDSPTASWDGKKQRPNYTPKIANHLYLYIHNQS